MTLAEVQEADERLRHASLNEKMRFVGLSDLKRKMDPLNREIYYKKLDGHMRKDGREEGRVEGHLKGQRQSLARVLSLRFGPLSESAIARLEAISDPARLD